MHHIDVNETHAEKTNSLNVCLPQQARVEKLHMKWLHTNSPAKKVFWAQRSVKKVMLTDFWGMKGLINIDVLEKVETVNRVS